MRVQFFIALLIVFFGVGVYWYQSAAAVCPVPLSYRLGTLDPSFELSEEAALVHIATAEAVWEEAVGRDLFQYDPSAAFPVNFVFDERQAAADSEAAQRAALDAQREKNDEVLATVAQLQSEYESLKSAYEIRAEEYEVRLSRYNTEVTKYNDRGGAPPDVFEALEDERTALSKDADQLSTTAAELNSLANRINELSERGNQLVSSYNQGVARYNQQFGFEREFTQGDYQLDEINIYKFSSEAELVTVLAHEFGHALGIDHVEGESSLMYYLLEENSSTPTLSADDLAAYYTVCGYEESFGQSVRRVIREKLAAF